MVALGGAPDADDPPWETEGCGVKSCSVSRAILFVGPYSRIQTTLALFSMPLVSGSLVAYRSTASASARFILSSAAASRADPHESPFNRLSIVLRAVSLLSALTSSQVPAPRATSAETPSFEVCSAKVGPRCFVFHHPFSTGARHHLCGLSIPT